MGVYIEDLWYIHSYSILERRNDRKKEKKILKSWTSKSYFLVPGISLHRALQSTACTVQQISFLDCAFF